MRFLALGVLIFGASGLACATLADAAPGDENLPNAGAGPFRDLRKGELGLLLSAPNVMVDSKTWARDVSVIDADGEAKTPGVVGYFAANESGSEATDPPVAIRRTEAADGRSFVRQAEVVLSASEAWEGGTVGAPSAVRTTKEVFLYYAAAEGIGLARSSDGVVFTKVNAPVLKANALGWDAGLVPRSPGVVRLGEASWAMFYEVTLSSGKRAIGEARSEDGLVWSRFGDEAALPPGPSGEEAYDDVGVGAPCAVVAESGLGRPLLRLYYSAESSTGKQTVGLAGRYEGEAFERAVSPVFGVGNSRAPHEPSVLLMDGFSLLFVTQHRTGSQEDPVVAAGVAPPNTELPPATEN